MVNLPLDARTGRILSSAEAREVGVQIQVESIEQVVLGREVDKQRPLCDTRIVCDFDRGGSGAREGDGVGRGSQQSAPLLFTEWSGHSQLE